MNVSILVMQLVGDNNKTNKASNSKRLYLKYLMFLSQNPTIIQINKDNFVSTLNNPNF